MTTFGRELRPHLYPKGDEDDVKILLADGLTKISPIISTYVHTIHNCRPCRYLLRFTMYEVVLIVPLRMTCTTWMNISWIRNAIARIFRQKTIITLLILISHNTPHCVVRFQSPGTQWPEDVLELDIILSPLCSIRWIFLHFPSDLPFSLLEYTHQRLVYLYHFLFVLR